MPYSRNADLPPSVRSVLPTEAQTVFRRVFNSQEARGLSEERAFASAWEALKNQGWAKDEDTGMWHKVKKLAVVKIDAAEHLVFGWANIAIRKTGEQIEDLHGDMIDPDDLEHAAYQFVLSSRETGEMHEGSAVGHLVESCCFTRAKMKAMGLPEDALPEALWVGFFIPDDRVFRKVVSGEYQMFSIQGTAVPEEIAADAEKTP